MRAVRAKERDHVVRLAGGEAQTVNARKRSRRREQTPPLPHVLEMLVERVRKPFAFAARREHLAFAFHHLERHSLVAGRVRLVGPPTHRLADKRQCRTTYRY